MTPGGCLLRRAIFRDGTPRGSRPFHELIDMFHNHEATQRHDKVYALLGMCSNNMSKSKLLPDYAVPFDELFKRLIQFTLPGRIPVETQGGKEIETRCLSVVRSSST
ncbi:hypothetical protein BKA67DRAFT_561667, partial [Truncatella angustata]